MKSKPVALLRSDLGVTKTHNRPHVNDDNPFSESQFKTLKYRPEFPKRFGGPEHARAFCMSFSSWYNKEHKHAGISLLMLQTVHYGRAQQVWSQRQDVLSIAYSAYLEAFVRKAPSPKPLQEAVWINPPKQQISEEELL